jgi:glycosyltransferase involved in cell wall biosynthesis
VPEERIKVIYNALKPIDGVAPVPVPLQTPLKAVTVGRLVPWKQIDRILEAMASIPELGLELG